MKTKLVSEWKLSKQECEVYGVDSDQIQMFRNLLRRDCELFVSGKSVNSPIIELLSKCFDKVSTALKASRWLPLYNNIYFDKHTKGYWIINSDMFANHNVQSGTELAYVEDNINKIINDSVNEWSIPKRAQLLKLTGLSSAPFRVDKGRPSGTCYYLYEDDDSVYGFDCDVACLQDASIGCPIPFIPYEFQTVASEHLFIDILRRGFVFKEIQNDPEYKVLLKLFHFENSIFCPEYQTHVEELLNKSVTQKITNTLLLTDKLRADISPYNKKVLEDTELGHWSLWQDELDTSGYETISLPVPLVARDPKSSINDGVVAIDFGTKSTVVVYQKDTVNIHPMRVGTGDLSKEVHAHHYENPTIMEFIDLGKFISAYGAMENKPFTRWQDLTISHTAQNSLYGSESSKFNTFLDEIKQWAGDKNRKLKIVGQQGKIIDLPAFLELSDDDFNPIEIYAYYLGLYINNLNTGIFMDYILSFPVTYEMPVRAKIIESFAKGLRKSLPAELGQDTIAQLTVTKGASEPAAYALTALKEYGFDPEDDERIFYAVFDFGGGTTDFDFGIFREASGAKERRFDYVIEHFGAGGDKFLGGENLLELLAFEIFKKNKSALLAKGIQFEKHPEKDVFAGSEQLLSHSQEAKRNTKQLCVALRPYWEEHEDFEFDSSGEISVTLTDIHGVQHSAFALDVDPQELEQILMNRIEIGVENFFNALRLAFSNCHFVLNDIDSVKIFLAGNSSKSKYVQSIFEKHIGLHHQEMGITEGQSRFELFSPLGKDKQNVEKPTGKTGVAFGLIESREGGRIKVVDHNINDNDIRFKYYLGENKKNKFKSIVDREVEFNQWIEFTDAYYQKFEIFYTEQPNSSTGQMSISDSGVKKKTVKLDITDEEALVYIRVISPTKLEYVVATEDGININEHLSEINAIEL